MKVCSIYRLSKLLLLAAIVLLPTFCARIDAQVLRSGGSPKDKALEDKYRSDEIERVKREAETPEYRPTKQFPQIKEDFERIQIINSESLQARALNSSRDFERISAAATEIRKRASRLRSNLFPTSTGERTKQTKPEPELRDDLTVLLNELDKAIAAFVHNPMFKNTRVVNPEDSGRAERELRRVINLSAKAARKAVRSDR